MLDLKNLRSREREQGREGGVVFFFPHPPSFFSACYPTPQSSHTFYSPQSSADHHPRYHERYFALAKIHNYAVKAMSVGSFYLSKNPLLSGTLGVQKVTKNYDSLSCSICTCIKDDWQDTYTWVPSALITIDFTLSMWPFSFITFEHVRGSQTLNICKRKNAVLF